MSPRTTTKPHAPTLEDLDREAAVIGAALKKPSPKQKHVVLEDAAVDTARLAGRLMEAATAAAVTPAQPPISEEDSTLHTATDLTDGAMKNDKEPLVFARNNEGTDRFICAACLTQRIAHILV